MSRAEERQFNGIRKDAAPQNLPPGSFQEDEGSDRYRAGSWRRRRGMLHSSLAKFDAAVTGIIGIDLPGTDYALAIIEGNNIQGFTNVVVEPDSGSGGFGEGEFGGEGFGA